MMDTPSAVYYIPFLGNMYLVVYNNFWLVKF